MRGAAGGDRLSCNYNISSSVASLVTVKILLNAVVSENKLFATIDLTDFYLGATGLCSRVASLFIISYYDGAGVK